MLSVLFAALSPVGKKEEEKKEKTDWDRVSLKEF